MRIATLCALLLLSVPPAVAGRIPNGSQERMCGLGTYHDSLDLVFRNATAGDGETLVTVQVIGAFQREYAVVLKQVGSQYKLLRVSLQDQLWTMLGPPLHIVKTRPECLDIAGKAKVNVVEVASGTDVPQHLWEEFNRTELKTDTCVRKRGECVLSLDTTEYVVQSNRSEPLVLTEIGDGRGLVSENTALLAWVHGVLRTAAPQAL